MSEVTITLKPSVNGPMAFLKNDSYVGRSFDLYGEFSIGEQHFFKHCARGGAAVDVGANIGAHSVMMARRYSHLYAFEPQEMLYRILKMNLALANNTTCYQAAVGNEEGVIHLPMLDYSQENNFGGIGKDCLGPEPPKEIPMAKVQLRQLDKVEALRKEEKIDFIKIDVEGMEKEALEGAQMLLDQHKPILYVENDKAGKQEGLVRIIYNLGYVAYWHITWLFNPQNFAGNVNNVFPNVASYNLICVPKDSWLKVDGAQPCTPTNWGLPNGCSL